MSGERAPAWVPFAARAVAGVLCALGATWRYEYSNAPEYDAAVSRGERFVYCFWHSRILPMAYAHRAEGIAVLVSRHRDGEIITRTIEALGYVAARGSSTRGGEAGLREMIGWAERGAQLAVTPDGPRGPAEVVKDGLVYLASRLGRRIVPLACSGSRAWTARSWDRHHVPLPFARVCYTHGAPITVPPIDGEATLERSRTEVESALRALTAEVRRRSGEAA